MRISLKSSGWILLCLILLPMTLSGCGHKTTISEGNLYLQAQAQQVQINSYKSHLKFAKDQLTQVIPQVQAQSSELPRALLADLTTFLVQNDCTSLPATVKDQCYKVTRVKLIEITRLLDETRMNEYAGQRTIVQLIATINTLIDTLGEPQPMKPPE